MSSGGGSGVSKGWVTGSQTLEGSASGEWRISGSRSSVRGPTRVCGRGFGGRRRPGAERAGGRVLPPRGTGAVPDPPPRG